MWESEEFETPKQLTRKDIESIYLDLKVLSNLQINSKLKIVKDKLKLDNYSLIQGIYRYYNNDSRDNTIEYVEKILKNLEIIMPYLKDTDKKKDKANFIMIFPQVINGLNNLKKTYQNDQNIIIRIDYFQECIRNFINELI